MFCFCWSRLIVLSLLCCQHFIIWLHPIYLWVPPEKGPKSCISNIRVGLGPRGFLMVIGACGSDLATTTKTTAPTATATATAAEDFWKSSFRKCSFWKCSFLIIHVLKIVILKMQILKMLILQIFDFLNLDFFKMGFSKMTKCWALPGFFKIGKKPWVFTFRAAGPKLPAFSKFDFFKFVVLLMGCFKIECFKLDFQKFNFRKIWFFNRIFCGQSCADRVLCCGH